MLASKTVKFQELIQNASNGRENCKPYRNGGKVKCRPTLDPPATESGGTSGGLGMTLTPLCAARMLV